MPSAGTNIYVMLNSIVHCESSLQKVIPNIIAYHLFLNEVVLINTLMLVYCRLWNTSNNIILSKSQAGREVTINKLFNDLIRRKNNGLYHCNTLFT